MATIEKVVLAAKIEALAESWSPRLLGGLNGQHVKLARFEGAFVWHSHAEEDELFLVVQGAIEILVRDDDGERSIALGEGEFVIIPRGVEHKPIASEPASVLLFEPATTINTGDAADARTIRPEDLKSI